jgi:hypothetical protein
VKKVILTFDPMRECREPQLPIEPWLVRHHELRHLSHISGLILELEFSPRSIAFFNTVIIRSLNDELWSTAFDPGHGSEKPIRIGNMKA